MSPARQRGQCGTRERAPLLGREELDGLAALLCQSGQSHVECRDRAGSLMGQLQKVGIRDLSIARDAA